MAWTDATLKQAIQDYCETDETTFVNNLDNIITQTEERILKRVQLPDFIKNATANTVSGLPYVGCPSDFLTPYSLAVDNAGYDYLLFKDVNAIRQMYPDASATGAPKIYAQFDTTNFILGPTPDAAYDIELHYFHRPESITTAGTSWLGTNAVNALLYGCIYEAYVFLKGDMDLMQVYQQRYEEGMARLEELGEGYATTDDYRYGDVRKPRT